MVHRNQSHPLQKGHISIPVPLAGLPARYPEANNLLFSTYDYNGDVDYYHTDST